MQYLIRYNLRDILVLLALVPLSTGLAHLADLASGATLDYFQPTFNVIVDGITSMAGGLSAPNRSFFIYLFNGIASGLLLSCLMVSFLLLRNYWTTLVAFSFPCSMLFITFPRFWTASVPFTPETALVLVQPTAIAATVAACMFAFFVYYKRRIETAALRTKADSSVRPFWQKFLLGSALSTYILLCVLGWHEITSFREAWIESREFWENIELE